MKIKRCSKVSIPIVKRFLGENFLSPVKNDRVPTVQQCTKNVKTAVKTTLVYQSSHVYSESAEYTKSASAEYTKPQQHFNRPTR